MGIRRRAVIRPTLLLVLTASTLAPARAGARPAIVRLRVDPSAIVLDRPRAVQRALVTGVAADGTEHDLTGAARLTLDRIEAVRIESDGRLASRKDGSATLAASYVEGKAVLRTEARVQVRNAGPRRRWSFTAHVAPVFAGAGCGSVACHGAAAGKGGFRLSAFGADPERDYRSLLREGGGRRVSRIAPADSLILLKATTALPHGGGRRFHRQSPEYRLLADWLADGAPWETDPARVTAVEVFPRERLLTLPSQRQRVLVTALYSDGTREDVSDLAQTESRNENALLAARDVMTAVGCGEAPVLVRYAGVMATISIGATTGRPSKAVTGGEGASPIDREVFGRLARLRVAPAPLADPWELTRRVTLDLIGRIPTGEEIAESTSAGESYERLVDRLMTGPEFNRYWRDVLHTLLMGRESRASGAWGDWLERKLREDTGWDRISRALLLAGPSAEGDPDGPALSFLDSRFAKGETGLDQVTRDVSRIFFGVDIQCARCHAHPAVPAWKQNAYWGIAAFFVRTYRIQVKGKQFLAEKAAGETDYFGPNQEKIQAVPALLSGTAVPHEPMLPEKPESYLVAPEASKEKSRVPQPKFSRRALFVELAINGEDRFFRRALVNWIWARLMGRGLVEPPDQLHAGNPPSHPVLLDELSARFAAEGFRLKPLIRNIVTSRAYRLTSAWNAPRRPAGDLYAVAALRPLEMQPLAESILIATGHWSGATGRVLQAMPDPGTGKSHPPAAADRVRLELEKAHAAQLAELRSRLDAGTEAFQAGSVQALYLANNPGFYRLIREGGLIARLAPLDDGVAAREAFLAVLGRPPTPEESAGFQAHLRARSNRRAEALAQGIWALLTTSEFRFNH